jgi:iron(II)-dependent oxidoreductase
MTKLEASDFGRELLAQSEWLRALARTLVQDAELAEDLVQETWLSALRTRPAPEGGLRGWLGTVLRNRARTRDVVERACVQQEVVAAVMALDEPYRETLLLRYFDELPPRTIAAHMHVPVSTVKSRLARGLERLRERLDASHAGERRVWMGSVAVLFEVEGGGWLGKALAAAAGLLVFGAGATWVVLEAREGARPRAVVSQLPPSPDEPFVSQRTQLERASMRESDRVAAQGRSEAAEREHDLSEHDLSERLRDLGYITSAPAPKSARQVAQVPPGLVLVEGGFTTIGTQPEELASLLGSEYTGEVHADLPRQVLDVAPFYLMVTEVTHEQYAEFVTSTGAPLPIEWIEPRLAGKRRSASEAGTESSVVGEIDPQVLESWSGVSSRTRKKLPRKLAECPVVGLTFEEARAYARWAGLRLMSELEYEHAVRGREERQFPWGVRWMRQQAATLESSRLAEVVKVGRFRHDRSPEGLHDLAGNAAEWTSSMFEGFGRVLEPQPVGLRAPLPGDASLRVVRGGSVAASWTRARASAREGVDPARRGSALGFRCAASPQPGLDAALAALESLPPQGWPGFQVERVVSIDRWIAAGGGERVDIDGYRVIQGYEHVLFVPALGLELGSLEELRRASATGESRLLGLLSTSLAPAAPSLPAGTYLVALRFAGQDGPARLDLIDTRGELVATLDAGELGFGPPARAEGPEIASDTLRLPLFIEARGGRGLVGRLNLRFEPGALAGEWRR